MFENQPSQLDSLFSDLVTFDKATYSASAVEW